MPTTRPPAQTSGRAGQTHPFRRTWYCPPTPGRSVYDPIPAGVTETGQQATTPMFPSHTPITAIIGARASGKTTLAGHVIDAAVRARDAVVWLADYDSPDLAARWIADRRCPEGQLIDWVAVTVDQTVEMLRAAYYLGQHRKHQHQKDMIDRGLAVLPVSADLPAVVVVVAGDLLNDSTRAIYPWLIDAARSGWQYGIHIVLVTCTEEDQPVRGPLAKLIGHTIHLRRYPGGGTCAAIGGTTVWPAPAGPLRRLAERAGLVNPRRPVTTPGSTVRPYHAQPAETLATITPHCRLEPAAPGIIDARTGCAYAARWTNEPLVDFRARLERSEPT